MNSIHLVRTYPHPREKVWRALTEPELLARWLMPNDFEARVGHRFTFQAEPAPGFDGVVHCEVQELEPPVRLVLSWSGGPIDTVVTFVLEETPAGTTLTMEQSGFEGLKQWLVRAMLALGTRTIYGRRLPAVLDDMEGEEVSEGPQGRECMSWTQRVIATCVGWMTRRSER